MKNKKAKGSIFTPQQLIAVSAYADTGDTNYAADKAGYAPGGSNVRHLLRRPEARAEIARLQIDRLFNDILPAAIAAHAAIIADPRTPAGARVAAIKLAYDRTLGMDDAAEGKEPHEMTPGELSAAIDRLKRIASDKARPVIEDVDATPLDDAPAPSIFD